jgi:hypothetical protein
MNARLATAILLSALVLGACTKQESIREVDWAKAALARNPQFEIVATDDSAGVFTVRDTASGEVRTLKLGELMAAPRPASDAAHSAAAAPAPVPTVEAADDATAAARTTDPMTTRTTTDTQTTEIVEAVPSASGAALAEGPGYSITRGTGSHPEAAGDTLEGPGYRIERSATTGNAGARQPGADETGTASPLAAEKRTDPIVCQGNRLMRIDGETIEFTGDAVIAERGCDLYISNARISAGGVGIIARQQARVHIVNSSIGGSRASYEVSDGAELYVARTTITGVGRRFDNASMTDLGGNSYESH